MKDEETAAFRAGRNIAMKVPPHQFAATVAFYRDVIGLPQLDSDERSECFAFGSVRLWIDRVDQLSQAEIWLEIQSNDTADAAKALDVAGVARCDQIEPLPAAFDGFWITNPAGIVHLVGNPSEDPDLPEVG